MPFDKLRATYKLYESEFYFIPFRSLQIWLNDFWATSGNSLRSPHVFLKNCLSIKFFSFAPPLSILARFSIAFFQKCHIQLSVFDEKPLSTLSLRFNNKSL